MLLTNWMMRAGIWRGMVIRAYHQKSTTRWVTTFGMSRLLLLIIGRVYGVGPALGFERLTLLPNDWW